MRNLKLILLAPALLLGADPAPVAPRAQWCKDNPEKCEQAKQRREEFCKNNPQTCETRRDAREARRKWCQDNPDKCQKLKDERDKRIERREEHQQEPRAGDK